MLRSVAVDPAISEFHIQQGTLSFERATTSLGDPASTATIEPGATLALRDCKNVLAKPLALYSDEFTCSLTNSSGSNVVTGALSLNGSCGIAAGGGTLALTGPLAGSGGLVKDGAGAVCIYGPALYSGLTTIREGPLRFFNSSPIASSYLIIAPGGTLDVSAISNGVFTLPPNRTLEGSGVVLGNFVVGTQCWLVADTAGGLSFSNNLTFSPDSSGCAMTISKQPRTNSQIRVFGNLALAGLLVIDVELGTNGFVSGEQFQLFSAGSYSGAFSQILPNTPAPGFVWDATQLNNSGVLRVVATQLPQLGPPRLNGNTLQFSGNGGMVSAPGDTYYILSSTNVALPIPQWNRVSTGQLDANRNFLFTDPNPMPGVGSVYYRLQLR